MYEPHSFMAKLNMTSLFLFFSICTSFLYFLYYLQLLYYSVDQNSILTFSPTTSSGGDLSNAPQEIDIEIDFYQFSETDKKITK